MDTIKLILLCACVVIFVVNFVACYRVSVGESYEPNQKYIQYALIWFLPLLGAGLAYALNREPKMTIRSYPLDSSAYDTGDPFAGNGSGDYFGGDH